MIASINLLPKKTFWQIWFVPLIGGLLAVSLLLTVWIFYGSWLAERQHADNQAGMDRTQLDLITLRQERIPDPLIRRFDQFRGLVDTIEANRFEWVPIMQQLTSYMPLTARMVQAQSGEGRTVEMSADFYKLLDVAVYVHALYQLPEFDKVSIVGVTERKVTVGSMLPVPQAELPATGQGSGGTFTPASDDPLLQELEWLILREALQQETGITLPEHNPNAQQHNPYPELEGAFTPEEIAAARESVKDLTAGWTGGGMMDGIITNDPAEEIVFYRVELSVTIAQTSEPKES